MRNEARGATRLCRTERQPTVQSRAERTEGTKRLPQKCSASPRNSGLFSYFTARGSKSFLGGTVKLWPVVYLPLAQPCFPTMNPCELVDHIRSGPAELDLQEPLQFCRQTCSNPCDFDEFLQALQSSETIRTVRCSYQQTLGITEHE
jgi:hypothetical protein